MDKDHASVTLRSMTPRDVDHLVKRCAAALKSHGNTFLAGRDKEDALAAFEATMGLLLELRDIHPGKRADIDRVLVRFGYPVAET